MAAAQLVQQKLRGSDVPLDRLAGLAGDECDPDSGRQVIDLSDPLGYAANKSRVADRAADDGQPLVAGNRGQVGSPPGRFVIDHRDRVAAGQEGLGQVRTNESGAAGYEDLVHKLAIDRGSGWQSLQ
jgi:hypothetical protein